LTERDRLINVFRQDSKESYNIWPVTTDLYTSAGDLCRSHRLRAYDAVQLACTLALRKYELSHQVAEPIFVCADSPPLHFTTCGKNGCMLSLGHFSCVWDLLELDTTVTLTGINGALNRLASARSTGKEHQRCQWGQTSAKMAGVSPVW
jgi:hypothetical protein